MCSKLFLLISLCLLIASCSPATIIPIDVNKVILLTDHSSYLATDVDGSGPIEGVYNFTLTARVQNKSSQAIYLARCTPDSPQPIFGVGTLEKDKESAYGPVWGCVGHDQQFVLGPGASRTDSYTITGPNIYDGLTNEPLGILEGQFVLGYEISACPGDGGCSPAERRSVTSQPFEVRLQR